MTTSDANKASEAKVPMTATTLTEVVQRFNTIAENSTDLGSRVRAILDEAKVQMHEAIERYLETVDADENATQPELCTKMREAIERYQALENLWNQTMSLNNRAANFAGMEGRHAGKTMKVVANAWLAKQPAA